LLLNVAYLQVQESHAQKDWVGVLA
jgi:hypothetical protein